MPTQSSLQAELDRTNRMIKNLEEMENVQPATKISTVYGSVCTGLILAYQHRRHLTEALLPTARMREEMLVPPADLPPPPVGGD